MGQLFTTQAEVMVSTAGGVDQVNDHIHAELNRLANTVDGLRGSWQGAAQASFDGLMERYHAAAINLENALSAISDNLRANAGNFSEVEASNEQAFTSVGLSL